MGVAHRVQSKQKGAEDSEDQKQFRRCIAGAIERLKPLLVAEEFSAYALEKLRRENGIEYESVTKAMADSFKIEHRFCDPDADARARMGYIEGTELALQIALEGTEGLSNAEVNDRGFAIEIAKHWPLREKFWLDQLGDMHDMDIIFVCGDAHVDSFRELLKQNGIKSTIVSRHVGVTQSDDEFWNRVMLFLEAHPELRE